MYQYCLSIASVTFGMESPWLFKEEPHFEEFFIPWTQPDILYRILPQEKEKKLDLIYDEKGCEKYTDGNTIYQRNYSGLKTASVFLTAKQTKNLFHIYYPPEAERDPLQKITFSRMISWEENFLDWNAFYLHSSCVRLEGRGIIFTAPSGTGKSTQASLWEKYKNAETLNGDRTVIRREEREWRCYGSPYAGSSHIYRNESAALSAIFVLEQGTDNTLNRLSMREAFICLYRETVQNPWNRNYVEAMTALLEHAVREIPIYRLTCRPDQEAVELVYKTVFQGHIPLDNR